jgi:hypothetical protein
MRTAVLFNTTWYGQVRSWALGMVAHASERLLDVHGLRAACVDFDGHGMALVGPKGFKRGSTFFRLMEDEKARFLSNDYVFVRYRGGEAIADAPERKFYLKTSLARELPRYARLFDRSKCENVVTSRAEWTNLKELGDDCPLDFGEPYCYWGCEESRALVDASWIGGAERVVKRSRLKTLVLLAYEPSRPAVEKLGMNEALDLITEGAYRLPTDAGMAPVEAQPFFNPYRLVASADEEDLQRRNFHQLLRVATVYRVNLAAVPGETLASRIRELIG